jgi:hypothetical protein
MESIAKQADPAFDAGVPNPPPDIFEMDHGDDTGE